MTRDNLFVECSWRCTKCHKTGISRVFVYLDEKPSDVANRHTRETRDRCVAGCAFIAKPPEGGSLMWQLFALGFALIAWAAWKLWTRPDPNVLPDTPARRRLNLEHERKQQRYVE